MRNRLLILKILSYVFFLIVLYFLQAAVFPRIPIWGIKPLIMPLAAVCIGVFEGSLWGGFLGLLCGLLCDFSVADTTVLFTVYLTILGFGAGLLSEYVLARGFPSFFVCSIVSLLLAAFLQSFKFLVYQGVSPLIIGRTALFQTIYSMFFVLPVYYSVRTISSRTKV